MSRYGPKIAQAGLSINAIKLSPEKPFLWASGYQMPIYNDNRMFLFYPEHVDLISSGFKNLIITENLPHDVIAGTSTAGISWGANLARDLRRPLTYIRDKPKDHGLKNQIEGLDAEKDYEGRNVLVIEDLISTGGSSARAVQAVRNANGRANHCVSIFSYGLDAALGEFEKIVPGCQVHSLLTYDILLQVAKEEGYITQENLKMLEEWRADPSGWGEKHGFPKKGGK